MQAIGIVRSTRKNVSDDDWYHESSYIVLNDDFPEDSLDGLNEFSHAEIIFFMDRVDENKIEKSVRHPRNNTDFPKVGVFAQRGKNRPNQIGVTACEITRIEGRKLFLRGLDAVDGTPVLDIKPWMREFSAKGSIRQPKWCSDLMKDYWQATPTTKPPSIFDPIRIDTEHVKIRPLQTVTWQKLAADLLYENSFHALLWGVKTPEDMKKRFEAAIAAFESQNGNPIVFLNHDETEIVGMTNFMNAEPSNKMIEIGGTWINQKYQRTNVNTETKLALLTYAFETLQLNRVEFRIDAENTVSQRAVQRLGFHFDGLMPRRKVNANNDVRDYVFYSVTDQNWPTIKAHIQELIEKSKQPDFEIIQKSKQLLKADRAEEAFSLFKSSLPKFSSSPGLHYLERVRRFES